MITPQELETKEFGVSFRGYDKDEIDDFLDALQKDYEKLYTENASMKNKMVVLVSKIDEYKDVEESLRNALLTAQKMGENMISDAKSKSELMVNEAQMKAERILTNLNNQIAAERKKLEDAKRENEVFRARLCSLYQAQIKLLENMTDRSVIDGGVRAALEGAQELAKLKKEMKKEQQQQQQQQQQREKSEEFTVNIDENKQEQPVTE